MTTHQGTAQPPWADPTRLDEHRERSCTRKQRYGRRTARRAARILRDKGDRDAIAYPCGFCGRWHVGRNWEAGA